MARKATVPTHSSGRSSADTAANTATTAKQPTRTGTGCNRSERQPPIGRMITASTTKPAVRSAASPGVRPKVSFR